MPRGLKVPAPATDRVEEGPMEIEAPVAQQGREEAPIAMSCLEYQFLCDQMSFFRFEIADIRREDREDRYLESKLRQARTVFW